MVAPDKFKGSLTAAQVAATVAAALRALAPEAVVVEHPVADGGEGTVDLALRTGFAPVVREVPGPLGEPVSAVYAMLGDTAVIEMASAAGLSLLPSGADDETAARGSTYGVGVLVTDALDRGARRIVLGVGGSATTDGGAGAAVALGARLRARSGEPVGAGGIGLLDVASVDLTGLDPRLRQTEIVIACDVDNPLTGETGAAAVYGPQKGASSITVAALAAALESWADVVAAEVGYDRRDIPGAGAAGGIGFAAMALFGARLVPGIELLLELTGFRDVVRDADLVVVGEGSLDEQSLRGKGPVGVASLARRSARPAVVAVVGRGTLTRDQVAAAGLDAVYALTDLEPREETCIREARRLLEAASAQIASDWLPDAVAVGGLRGVRPYSDRRDRTMLGR